MESSHNLEFEPFPEMKKHLSLIPALLEDEAADTRLFSCEVIYWTISNYSQLIKVDIFHTLAGSKYNFILFQYSIYFPI